MSGYDSTGAPLVPGYNVDRVDAAAGLAQAKSMGYTSANAEMVVGYALRRHRDGEEDGARRTALSGGIDLTSWYAILAAALAAAAQEPEAARQAALGHAARDCGAVSARQGIEGIEDALARYERLSTNPHLDRLEQAIARSVAGHLRMAKTEADLVRADLEGQGE